MSTSQRLVRQRCCRARRSTGRSRSGDYLGLLGISSRAAALAQQAPERADEIVAAHQRLTDPATMGTLFRVMGLTAPAWPVPAGFA